MDNTMIEMDFVVRRDPGTIAAEVSGEVVMMSVQRGNYYALDAIGSRIWALLGTQQTVESLCEVLVQEYEVDLEICQHDVCEFLAQLVEQQLVTLGK